MGLRVGDVAKINLLYLNAYTDVRGKRRHYFRRLGFKAVALPGLPGSGEFMAAYEQAIAGVTAPKREIGAERTKAASLSALIVAYYTSSAFKALSEGTQASRRRILEKLRAAHGDKPVARLEPRHVRKMMDEKAETPEAANNLRKAIRAIMRYAVDYDWRPDDPTANVKKIKVATEGFHTWTEAEIAAYEAFWPLGTRERLALALLLYTAVRRADVVKLGRQHVEGDHINIRPGKARTTTNVHLQIRMHPDLKAAIDAMPRDSLTFLQTQYGQPFTPGGFGNWFVASVKAAGLGPGVTAHGLRKGIMRRLAEDGASGHELKSVSGHASLKDVEIYTRKADQKRLAESAMDKMRTPKKAEG